MIELLGACLDDMNPNWHIEEKATLTDILILVVSGQAIYTLDGERVELNKGDMLFIPEGMMRSAANAPDRPHQKYSLHFTPHRPGSLPFDAERRFRKISAGNFDLMKSRFAALLQHWLGRQPHEELISVGIAIELLGYFARELAEEKIASAKLRLVREAQEYIRTHYRERIRIEDLARRSDRAPNYITQTFKYVTGMTPIDYMHQIRIYAARELILDSRMTIGEVSDYLGYSDQAYFNRMFKRIMGCPPSYIQKEGPGRIREPVRSESNSQL